MITNSVRLFVWERRWKCSNAAYCMETWISGFRWENASGWDKIKKGEIFTLVKEENPLSFVVLEEELQLTLGWLTRVRCVNSVRWKTFCKFFSRTEAASHSPVGSFVWVGRTDYVCTESVDEALVGCIIFDADGDYFTASHEVYE